MVVNICHQRSLGIQYPLMTLLLLGMMIAQKTGCYKLLTNRLITQFVLVSGVFQAGLCAEEEFTCPPSTYVFLGRLDGICYYLDQNISYCLTLNQIEITSQRIQNFVAGKLSARGHDTCIQLKISEINEGLEWKFSGSKYTNWESDDSFYGKIRESVTNSLADLFWFVTRCVVMCPDEWKWSKRPCLNYRDKNAHRICQISQVEKNPTDHTSTDDIKGKTKDPTTAPKYPFSEEKQMVVKLYGEGSSVQAKPLWTKSAFSPSNCARHCISAGICVVMNFNQREMKCQGFETRDVLTNVQSSDGWAIWHMINN